MLTEVHSEMAETFFVAYEPQTIQEKLEAKNYNKWIKAINKELESLEENKTWILVPESDNVNIILNYWILKKNIKQNF